MTVVPYSKIILRNKRYSPVCDRYTEFISKIDNLLLDIRTELIDVLTSRKLFQKTAI